MMSNATRKRKEKERSTAHTNGVISLIGSPLIALAGIATAVSEFGSSGLAYGWIPGRLLSLIGGFVVRKYSRGRYNADCKR